MSLSLATVMKEWGVHRGGIDRQLSFAMKDLAKTSSLKAVLKFSKKQKVRVTDTISSSAVNHLIVFMQHSSWTLM